jgi:hypothetical protein
VSEDHQTGRLRSFFALLEAGPADLTTLARLYAPAIVVAGPTGSQVVTIDNLLLGVQKRKQLFEAAGCQRTELVHLEETPLDDRYTLTRTEWRWQFARPDRAPTEITLPSTFIVERTSEGPRIVLYLMHADVVAVLRQRGLLPGS